MDIASIATFADGPLYKNGATYSFALAGSANVTHAHPQLLRDESVARNRPMVEMAVHCITSTRHISGLVAHGCIIQVVRNGNLQIEMHSFASQQLPQR
jgi:hypothetical protein